MKFEKNEGPVDRAVRFIIGLVAGFIGYFYASGIVQILLFVIAFLGLFTAISGVCLLYKILGINTNRK